MATSGGKTGRREARPPGRAQRMGENSRPGKQNAQKRTKTKPCRFIEHEKTCPYGENCTYSHDTAKFSTEQVKKSSNSSKEQQERMNYNAWKRIIKSPPKQNDLATIKRLWTGALDILEGFDRNWKQMLPRDLDADENFGREHIQTLLNMRSHGNGCKTFVELSQTFLAVITHPAMLDCLSIDTVVGGLYNFISGTNGQRAIGFFTRLCTNLATAYGQSVILKSMAETTLTSVGIALHELLRREQRAAYNDELPDLVTSLENAASALDIDTQLIRFNSSIAEVRARIGRAIGLLKDKEIDDTVTVDGFSTTAVKSYPRPISVPGTRHDNDHADITKIRIMPTNEEICCELPDYLPTTDCDQPSFITNATDRHIDTLFRLLRHDIFGELKHALGILIHAIKEDESIQRTWNPPVGDIRAYAYPNARIQYVSFERRTGIEAQVSFSQLPALQKKTSAERSKWWADSKRLEEAKKTTDLKESRNLGSNEYNATITTKLVTRNRAEFALLTELSSKSTNGVLVEFPGVILATFMPILNNLQAMQSSGYIPFSQWILPDRATISGEPAQILPPLYTRNRNYFFILDPILKRKDDSLSFSPTTSCSTTILQNLEERTTLDHGQCQALIAALTREYAFIQGPPGTGKSYIGIHLMKVLLACSKKSKLGPVIVVCYTNHALDQFLEELVKAGVEKLIRIGGQSKSKILEGHNLRVVSNGEGKTRNESFFVAKAYEALQKKEPLIHTSLAALHALRKEQRWGSLKTNILHRLKGHIKQRYPLAFNKFSRVDENDYEIVGKDPFDVWCEKAIPRELRARFSINEEANIQQILENVTAENISNLPIPERELLINFWAREYCEIHRDQLFELVDECSKLHEQLNRIHDERDRRVLESAEVIGVTTTGLAKRISVLRRLRSKVVICEEAGEVMEPHMISALLPNVEHFIQIGDHQQLRPQINNYELSLESKQGEAYQLDRSQFERLSIGEPGRAPFPVAQLDTQRRMRPEISCLIRMTLYPRLVDHPSTKTFPDVVGMRNNVFWLDHENMEDSSNSDQHQRSHSNSWEVDMAQSLVRHIIRQGVYESKDIALLTPYTGQLQKLRAKLRSDFEIVLSDRDLETLAKDGSVEKKNLSEFLRVATVDNFQGEESKIVIISLVRSNKEKKVGFLRTTNRINVLLSRAQHGMYLIGNADTYSNVPMWAKVIGMLDAEQSVGKRLGLCCSRHMDTVMQVSEPLDFEKFSPEGGCQLPCDRRLTTCGHKCLARCHSDAMHEVFQCPQPCQRLHSPCKHGCQKQTCGEDCGVCMIKIDNVLLPCEHTEDGVPCYRTQDVKSIKCNARVQKRVPKCNHLVDVPCFRDVSIAFLCPTKCEASLPCGHRCPGTCSKCYDSEHQECTKICGRRFGTCNHTCPRTCHDGTDCGPCLAPCEVRCSHSQCTLRCHEPCAPCVESCTWSCEHQGKCELPCAAPCNRLPCNERCSKNLSCGHQCPGICGEECAEGYCQKCSTKLDARVDFVEMKSYEDIDVNETPIVVLGCGHFFTTESVDCLMDMAGVYEINKNGEFTGLKDISTDLAPFIPLCPDCKYPVRQFATRRYNRVVNRAVIDEMSRRFLSSGKDGLQELERQIDELKNWQQENRENVINTGATTIVSNVNKLLCEGYERSKSLKKAVQIFCKNFADKCQPAQKLHEATVHAVRRAAMSKVPPDTLLTSLRISDAEPAPTASRGSQVTMGGQMALIKTHFLIVDDAFVLSKTLRSKNTLIKLPGQTPDKLATLFFQTCKKFIAECETQNLPKLAVEGTLLFASIARSFEAHCRSTKTNIDAATKIVETAEELLEKALKTCQRPFHNAEGLRTLVEQSIRSMKTEWYEEITSDEKEAIKAAMLSGPKGIATHSGHWYNCSNGHPFAIGDCGMPMELARCPECGASIGGRDHTAVQGVTRATEMED
ncbi:hypothetical protein H112_06949 [Trichophyton rubrum D6]|uniref:Uncharacterized protein n=1 Tax=Trichophyton rubrum CBS 288.86 TaxID=1215330 RepID=A0A022VU63_TRIRU|nr:hypothetical protein H100_06972 [Trichophyton rubrum MR850]EZF38860.1 hypothetical protein H102_06933 [Trichophyton rubrum CBS 100081]EZF49576.1 hypothetical protein H103_06957 [Trichophyton rubrum CBS 288.86]EZF60203.1 hypothetical protein H104_06912 [Trichophyton rubrum CBS 289.86]EZF81388.1 hypothetical protein H110_06953 [Trichophyton rubrum MR1448]EZG13704.1 hypothetical protein H107_07113 [Trichophyton rubrum CBS 202.88]KDB30649.1 hypothetical protein H112_06949 [Trichophyton rubrum 